MRILFFVILIAGLGYCSQPRADNTVYIDQVGDNNTYTVSQNGDGQNVNIAVGKVSSSDGNAINITQRDATAKTANVSISSGINNSVSITQQGTGNHTANIQNLSGSANTITVGQSGEGNHSFSVINNPGTTNNNNTINATQSGGVGADKWFNVWLNGASGANVSVTQTNPTTPGQASMSIMCMPGTCGNWSYNSQ